MDFAGRMDPELAEALQGFPENAWDFGDLPVARANFTQMIAALRSVLPPVEGVSMADHRIPGPAGAPNILVRVYTPDNRPDTLPGMLWIHGGGYILGNIDQDDLRMQRIARTVGCVVASVEYRLAPEHPFPAPLDDCYAALTWFSSHAAKFGVDPARIAIGGASAGGGLAAGLALLARDRGEVSLAFQLLIYPMIDDRNVLPASHAITDGRVWNREKNLLGWKAYLGRDGGSSDVPAYAAAYRATDLRGLPPAYISVGDLDLFLDENIEYAQRLLQADVPTELHVYPGAYHGFDGYAPFSKIAQRFNDERDHALIRALHP
jgi:acetyl esterase/lipase